MKPGDLKLADVNGDNMLDERDRIFVGSYQPKTYYGINLGIGWKRSIFRLTVMAMPETRYSTERKLSGSVTTTLKRPGPTTDGLPTILNGTQPRASNAIPAPSTYFVESGDFFRINNVTLGYTLNSEKWGTGISRLRLYASAQNPVIQRNIAASRLNYQELLPVQVLNSVSILFSRPTWLASIFHSNHKHRRMKTQNKIILVFAGYLVLCLSSCSDSWLDPAPENQLIKQDSTFIDPANAVKFVNACYNSLLQWKETTFSWIGMSSITSDDADKGSDPGRPWNRQRSDG